MTDDDLNQLHWVVQRIDQLLSNREQGLYVWNAMLGMHCPEKSNKD